jgi:hypothetical protein
MPVIVTDVSSRGAKRHSQRLFAVADALMMARPALEDSRNWWLGGPPSPFGLRRDIAP